MKALTTGKTMTMREIANALGVSYDTINNCVKRVLPNKLQHGKRAYFNEEEVAIISKELKSNTYVASQLTVEAGSTVMSTTTRQELVDNIRQAQEAFNKAMLALVQDLQAENEVLSANNTRLTEKNTSLQVTLDISKSFASVKLMERLNPKRKFDWRVLKRMSNELSCKIEKCFDQNYGEVNAYAKEVWEACYELDSAPWDKE